MCTLLTDKPTEPSCPIQGTGQGGILSPTIWNFVMDLFLELFETHTADVLGYAVDRAIISIANDIDIAQQVMQTALNKAQAWADTVGLEFSIAKTKAMIFSRQKEPPTIMIPLQMVDEDIEEVDTFKYLRSDTRQSPRLDTTLRL
jgi:hypothetical protein